jgi:hypothetical protein
MGKFEDVGPIREFGSVIERRAILRFFFGTVVLTGLVTLVFVLALMLFLSVQPPSITYILIAITSLVVGIAGTVLAIRAESEAVFVPFLRIAPEDGVKLFRSADPLDDDRFEYHVVLPTDTEGVVIHYRGLGASAESVDLLRATRIGREQAEFDTRDLRELNQPVYAQSISL